MTLSVCASHMTSVSGERQRGQGAVRAQTTAAPIGLASALNLVRQCVMGSQLLASLWLRRRNIVGDDLDGAVKLRREKWNRRALLENVIRTSPPSTSPLQVLAVAPKTSAGLRGHSLGSHNRRRELFTDEIVDRSHTLDGIRTS